LFSTRQTEILQEHMPTSSHKQKTNAKHFPIFIYSVLMPLFLFRGFFYM